VIPPVLEIALRGLLAGVAVWAGLRMMGVRYVLAQKSAWVLVLAAAVLMPALLPLAARWPVLPAGMALRVPAYLWQGAAYPPVSASRVQSSVSSHDSIAAASTPYHAALTAESVSEIPVDASSASLGSSLRSTIQTPPPPAAQRFHAPERHSLLPTMQALAWAVYFAVCGVLMLRLIYGLTSAVSLWLDAEPVEFAHAQNLRLRSSRAISSPVTVGSGVVLPAGYDEWDLEKLRIVLAHERSHVRQGDFYLQLLAGLYAAVFWFSPLGWWIKRKLSDLGEAISDRAALREAESRSSYARILLEFAGMPRPTLIGVAMARPSSLSHRIERLLNESSFRQAFFFRRSSALAAILLVPAALLAATVSVRVQAAGQQTPAEASQPSSASTSGVSHPDAAQDAPVAQASPTAPTAPDAQAAPSAPADPGVAQAPPAAAATPEPPEPPEPPSSDDDDVTVGAGQSLTITNSGHGRRYMQSGSGNGYAYSFDSEGESYALVMEPGDKAHFSGNYHSAEIEKAKRAAHGAFLWFTHDGRSYVVDDPAIVNQIEAMYKPIEALGHQQEELGKQQEELGRQQEELGRKQEEASVPTPDISKEIAKLSEALAKLRTKEGGAITSEDLADIQNRIGDIQGRLGDLQGQIGAEQGRLGEEQGKLGEQQGKLGAEQGRLGAEQGRIARDADRKVKSIIDQSLQNGKARPVE
jgi:beta-lactamase regulating signal transducer with metallopeptidase domain